MSIRNGWPAVSGAADQFDIRAALRATTAQDADGRIKTGCAVNAQSLKALVTPRQDMAVDLSASDWILDRHGPIFLSVDGTETIGLDPAPSANSRIDTIWIKQQEAQSPIGDPSDGPLAGRTTGTPSISPTRPGIPDGALAIADVLVPSTATNTSSDGVVITQRAPYTAMQGGILLFRNTAELDSFTPWDGQRARVVDVGEYVGSGGVWVSQSRTLVSTFRSQNAGSFAISGTPSLVVHPAEGWIEPDMPGVVCHSSVSGFPFLQYSGGVRPSLPVGLGRLFLVDNNLQYQKTITWNTDGSLTINNLGSGDALIPLYRRIPIPDGVTFA